VVNEVKRIRIGDLLVAQQYITQDQLESALAEQKKTGLKLGRQLIELGFIEENSLLNLLSKQLGIPFVELKHFRFDKKLVQLLPESVARRFRVMVLQKIFEEALSTRASDIHIEPDETVLRIRQRIDGVLVEHVMNEKRISSALVVRLKLMANLDISEKRLPQDGRFNLRLGRRNIDVRVSTMPVQFGESVVMRILDHSEGIRKLTHVGMPEHYINRFRKVIKRPFGLVLVTGPTGSGKTTTLYGALSELNTPEKKIITVEDPVEYRLPRVNQVQIHERIGLDFGSVLRATLRQDPDILLVGEIRDAESAEIALRAAMTGHLVLSTLHTNDAVTSSLRLIDMGVDPFLVAASLKAVIAQRLVRRVCESCIEEHELIPEHKALFLRMRPNVDINTITFKKGSGWPSTWLWRVLRRLMRCFVFRLSRLTRA